jgi:hypothetical protein
MATITRVAPSPDASSSMFARNISGLLAGETIAAGQACYIKSDGKAWLATGTSANAAAVFAGLAARAATVGQPVTLLGANSRWKYGSGLTPGARYYVSATAGALDDAATTGGTVAVAIAIDTTDIMVIG